MGDIHALPAYGRDYKSKAEVIKAWQDGKDFIDALSGRYLSSRDDLGGREVWIRFNNQRRIIKVC